MSLQGAVTLSPSKADISYTWFKSELHFLDTIQEISWSSAGTSLDKGQTSTLFIWLFRWLARLSGWISLFGKGRMSGLMQLQGAWKGSFTGSLRSGQKAVAVTKKLGKLYCWREMMLNTKALHYCVPVKSNFALILCVWGKIGKGEKAERNRYFPFPMKIECTIAPSLNSSRALAVKASWCSFSRVPVAWYFELTLGNGFMLKVDCGTQWE